MDFNFRNKSARLNTPDISQIAAIVRNASKQKEEQLAIENK